MKKILNEWKRYLNEGQQAGSIQNQEQADVIASETKSAEAALLDSAIEEQQQGEIEFVSNVQSPDPRQFAESFYESYNLSSRKGFLTPYSVEDFMKMKLFMVKSTQGIENAGFAIKDGDDIVSVHNNSDIRGIGDQMIEEAKAQGGSKLDHFDGFLSGYYRKKGFNVVGVDQWSENYIPASWDFPASNIEDPRSSVYAAASSEYGMGYDKIANLNKPVEMNIEGEVQLTANPADKTSQYRSGRPDVIYRKL